MNKQPYVITTGIVLALAIVTFNLSPEATARAKLVFNSFYIPLISAQKSTRTAKDYLINQTVPRKVLLKENAELKRQNKILELRLSQSASLFRENNTLRSHLQIRPRAEWNPRLAHIVGRDPANWWRTILIDLGSKDGVKTDMPVLAKSSIIGRVQEVYSHRSRVALLGDPDCRISVTVEATSENGILTASGGTVFDPTLVQLMYLPANTEARPGDMLYTSGLGEKFPRGIHVGKLLSVESTPGRLTSIATVKLAANTSKLNEVWILMP